MNVDLYRDTQWMEQAACVGTDPEAFFPPKGDSGATARTVCAGCPVMDQCLQYATNNFFLGIFAGTNERQRTEIRKGARNLIACDLCDAKFATKQAVAAHKTHRHSDRARGAKTPTPCPECGLTFGSKQGMANHRTYKHKELVA